MDRSLEAPADPARPRVVAIVQARLGSTRLPGKVLADIDDRPLIRVLLDRLKAARTVDDLVVAIPESPADDALVAVVLDAGCRVYRGSDEDVLDRYHRAAEWAEADVVVRVTGDCPLVDPALVDSVVGLLAPDPRIAYAAVGSTYPDGADCEAMRADALAEAWKEAAIPSDREHVTRFIYRAPDRFPSRVLHSGVDLGGLRFTVDQEADLDVVRELVRRLGREPEVGVLDYAAELLADPELAARNASVPRNEGLWRSLRQDESLQILAAAGGPLVLDASAAWWARAEGLIPEGTQTLSKAPNQFVRGVTPIYLARGAGSHVFDVDGNAFIDYPMALGAVVLGHAHPRIVEAVRRQVGEGTVFTLMHPLEVEVAEMLRETIPCAEMVRFAKTGSDVTSAAVRLARAVTGRQHVLVCGYHGWHDWYAACTSRSAGIPAEVAGLVHPFGYNDPDGLRRLADQLDGQVAAIVLEQGGRDPEDGFLHRVRDLASRAGCVLVFDEIVTGFRFARGGIQELYGVAPDLACFGKALGNGMPISVLAGRAEVMRELDRVFVSTTFGGETASLAAAKATLEVLRTEDVVGRIWEKGRRLRRGLEDRIRAHGLDVELVGHPPRSSLVFRVGGEESPALRALFLQETVRRGVLFGGPVFLTPSHSEWDLERTLDVVDEAFGLMARALESGSVEAGLDGPPPVPVLARGAA